MYYNKREREESRSKIPKTITKPKTTATMYHMHSRSKIHCSGGCFRFASGFGYNHHHYVPHAYICCFHMYA